MLIFKLHEICNSILIDNGDMFNIKRLQTQRKETRVSQSTDCTLIANEVISLWAEIETKMNVI